jgi:biopolymer transport protein ExbD
MTQSRAKKRPERVRNLNLAALLDICFLLMMFFLVTATHAADEGAIGLPLIGRDIGTDHIPDVGPTLTMQNDGNKGVKMKLMGRAESIQGFSELYDQLERLKRDVYGSGSPILIQPDRSVAWQHVVNALNQARRAEFVVRLHKPR